MVWGIHQQIKRGEQDNVRNEMPNIILIIADDLGIHDLSYGSGVATPNIDSIYKNGVRFINAYAGHATWFKFNVQNRFPFVTIFPFSAPSRAALYTGRFATRFGFEYTPIPKIFGKYFTHPLHNHIHQPIYHHENAHLIPPMSSMV